MLRGEGGGARDTGGRGGGGGGGGGGGVGRLACAGTTEEKTGRKQRGRKPQWLLVEWTAPGQCIGNNEGKK